VSSLLRAFTSGAKRAVGPRKLSNIRGDNVSKRDLLASALTLSATGMIMPVAGQRADVSRMMESIYRRLDSSDELLTPNHSKLSPAVIRETSPL
jgi:hypothetical protein